MRVECSRSKTVTWVIHLQSMHLHRPPPFFHKEEPGRIWWSGWTDVFLPEVLPEPTQPWLYTCAFVVSWCQGAGLEYSWMSDQEVTRALILPNTSLSSWYFCGMWKRECRSGRLLEMLLRVIQGGSRQLWRQDILGVPSACDFSYVVACCLQDKHRVMGCLGVLLM